MKFPFRKKPQQKRYIDYGTTIEEPADLKVVMPQWMYQPPHGIGRTTKTGEIFNPAEMRLLGASPTVWQCKKRIADAVTNCPWAILPIDSDHPNKEKMQEIDNFLRYRPNQNQETFNQIIFSTVMDVLDLDAGAIINVFGKYSKNKIVQLYSRDAALIYKQVDKYGIVQMYWQYDWMGMQAIPLLTKEVCYITLNPRSDSPYGESPLEKIKLIIRSLGKGIESQELVYEKGGIPSGILSLIGMNKDDFDSFKSWWQTELKDKPYKQAMINVEAKWAPLITSFRDLEFLETQKWFTELVYRTFKVPHYGLGAGGREVKGVPKEEYAQFMQETVKPILETLEQKINQQILPYLYPQGKKPDCYFHYTILDIMAETEKIELWTKKFDSGMNTINEYRKEKGLTPLAWGNCNPMALKQIQQFSQSYFYGALDAKTYEMVTGIPMPTEAIVKELTKKKEVE